MELEDRLTRADREKEELWTRAKDQYEGESERVDELMHDNDNLNKEIERL